MSKFSSPVNSKVTSGKIYLDNLESEDKYSSNSHYKVCIYRYDPEKYDISSCKNGSPSLDIYYIDRSRRIKMVLDLLIEIKNDIDGTLTFRRSCREGVCGSCAMNIDGTNTLACIKNIEKSDVIKIYPLPHLNVIKDLVPDMTHIYKQYKSIKPWLQNANAPHATKENIQSPENREKLDGLYECILCACCSTGCPNYWWNSDKFLGPAVLLQFARWIFDSRDTSKDERLNSVNNAMSVFGCRSIMNCSNTCPKDLNPAKAIGRIKGLLSDK